MENSSFLGLVAILFAIFIIGWILGTEPIRLIVILAIGALVFMTLHIKDSMAMMGFTVLIFALLFYLIYPTTPLASISISADDGYIQTIVLIVIVMVGLIMAYKATQ